MSVFPKDIEIKKQIIILICIKITLRVIVQDCYMIY